MATKKKSAPVFVANWQRNEVNGEFYQRGQEADLSGLSFDQMVYVLAEGHYHVKDGSVLSDELVDAVQDAIGG